MVTANGVEGGLIYALSSLLRDEIAATGEAVIYLDLDTPEKIWRVSSPRWRIRAVPLYVQPFAEPGKHQRGEDRAVARTAVSGRFRLP